MQPIKICLLGTPSDYLDGIIPLLFRHLGFHIAVSPASQADLIIYGPFYQKLKKYRYWPKPLRPVAQQLHQTLTKRQYQPITLFHTSENIRHDFIDTDYSISFDITNESHHFRMPYWMEMTDWSHEGITGNTNPRFGKLLSIERMMQPLGNEFLTRNRKAAFITSHLAEPRRTLFKVLSEMIEIDGFGPYFNSEIKNHHNSGFEKSRILEKYAFNLCPENSLYPGYYTEKIPEAFVSGCLPLTWVDSNVGIDFNPLAMINLQALIGNGFEGLKDMLTDPNQLKPFSEQALIIKKPSIEPLIQFLRVMLQDIRS